MISFSHHHIRGVLCLINIDVFPRTQSLHRIERVLRCDFCFQWYFLLLTGRTNNREYGRPGRPWIVMIRTRRIFSSTTARFRHRNCLTTSNRYHSNSCGYDLWWNPIRLFDCHKLLHFVLSSAPEQYLLRVFITIHSSPLKCWKDLLNEIKGFFFLGNSKTVVIASDTRIVPRKSLFNENPRRLTLTNGVG